MRACVRACVRGRVCVRVCVLEEWGGWYVLRAIVKFSLLCQSHNKTLNIAAKTQNTVGGFNYFHRGKARSSPCLGQ